MMSWCSGKYSTCRRYKKCGFDPWVGKIPWSRKWQATPMFLPGESQGQRSLVGCCLWGRTESDTTKATQQQHCSKLTTLQQKYSRIKFSLNEVEVLSFYSNDCNVHRSTYGFHLWAQGDSSSSRTIPKDKGECREPVAPTHNFFFFKGKNQK